MIVTVSPNPGLDRTLRVGHFDQGAVIHTSSARFEPSGEGINVSVALHAAGVDTTLVVPVGGESGRVLLAVLTERHVSCHAVPVSGAIRSNLSVIEDDGTTTRFNEPGGWLTPREVSALIDAAAAVGGERDWIAWCGSMRAGSGETMLVEAIARYRDAGRRVMLNSSRAALRQALRAGSVPHLVKPNDEELGQLVGRPLPTLGDVVDAASELVERGVDTVLVTLGREGAVLVDADGALFGTAPVERVVNTAGAGDAFLAGYLSVTGDRCARLRAALTFGALAVQTDGSLLESLPHSKDSRPTATIGDVDRSTRLDAP